MELLTQEPQVAATPVAPLQPPASDAPSPKKPPRRKGRHLPYWPLWVALVAPLCGLIVAAVGVGICSAIFGFGLESALSEELTQILFVAAALGFFALIGSTLAGGMSTARLGIMRTPVKTAVLWTAVIMVVVFAFDTLASQLIPAEQDPLIKEGDFSLIGILIIFGAVILAPVFEEIVCRGVLFPAFAHKLGVLGGVVVSGAIFGVLHFGNSNVWTVAMITVSGFVWAVLYWRTGSIIPGIVAHAFNNAIVIFAQLGVGDLFAFVAGFASIPVILVLVLPFARRRGRPQPFRSKSKITPLQG